MWEKLLRQLDDLLASGDDVNVTAFVEAKAIIKILFTSKVSVCTHVIVYLKTLLSYHATGTLTGEASFPPSRHSPTVRWPHGVPVGLTSQGGLFEVHL